MKRLLYALTLALSIVTTADAQTTSSLIVVEDRGGASALPYYQALTPQDADTAAPATSALLPASRNPADAEAAMLPIRSERLSPGDEPRRAIQAPGITPIFLIGDDDRSRAWLHQRQAMLRDIHAQGLVVNVASPDALAALRRLVPSIALSPVSGDELAERLSIRHYPVLITATSIEP